MPPRPTFVGDDDDAAMYSAPYDHAVSRSPGSHRHPSQPIPRQQSRQFDAYPPMSAGGLYSTSTDDYAAAYDASRSAKAYDMPQRNYDRANATVHLPYSYDVAQPSWNPGAFGQNNALSTLVTGRPLRPVGRGRTNLPQTWVDTQSSLTSFPNVAGGATSAPVGLPPSRPAEVDDELIPTAIVIKNIPFAVKKEQLVQLMTDLGLPLPYAFNYHFDSGVFRGLAFANFSSPDETSLVINMMNNFELQGRKLRVEYKKMLPQAERDRIEREKRERRGQLEEQHRPLPGHLQTQASYGSINSHMPATSPSPVSGRPSKLEVDMNDPVVLQFYTELVRFKDAADKESITFPPSLTPMQRRNVHMMAHQMGLAHLSKGNGEQRQVHVLKIHDTPNISPPLHASDQRRRSLNRSATTDFSDVRASDPYFNSAGPLARHTSALLAFPDSPGGLTALPNLRGAKSYADLRSITPSPAQSTASYPTVGPRNDFPFSTAASTAANVAVASTASPLAPRDEAFLVNGLSGLNVSSAFGQSSSPRSLRQMVSWDRENPGPIGGHRSFSTNYDEQARDRGQGLPSRQPRGPIPERGNGFVRARPNGHQGRGSDELSAQSAVEIVVEE